MAEAPRSGRVVTRGRPFVKGNPGRPCGARHRATLAAEALLDGEAEALTRKAIEQALAGDTVALRLCLERILPPRKERPIRLALPALMSATDATNALATVAEKVAEGELTPDEGAGVDAVINHYLKAVEITDLERRLKALEERS
jgi:hypothetical protein